jgi:alpha-glucosidase (family GH31 glycosyl hydrolase)
MRVVANLKPCLLNDHPRYAEAELGGAFIRNAETGRPSTSQFWDGEGAHLDFTTPAAVKWWQTGLREAILEYGIDSAWNDNNEYELWDEEAECGGGFGGLGREGLGGDGFEVVVAASENNARGSEAMPGLSKEPKDDEPMGSGHVSTEGASTEGPTSGKGDGPVGDGHVSRGGASISIALARPVLALLMTRASYEEQLRFKPEERPYTITRAGCPGIQRYGQTWSGDNTTR